MSAISTDGMDKWLDDAYPDLDRRKANMIYEIASLIKDCLLYTSPSPRDRQKSRMPSSA